MSENRRHTLAIDGGTPVRRTPLPKWPAYGPAVRKAVCKVIDSGAINYWTGEEGSQFEKEFAASVGAAYAVALANGTVALETALHAARIGAGDEVIVPAKTFVATGSSVLMRGARPVFADVDIDSQTVTAESIQRCLTKRTKAIIVVHLAGWPCDMKPILELARRARIKVIEDCAQAQGALYNGRNTGSLGDIAAFSFCQDKIMSTGGEGGMVTTRSEELWRRAWSFKDHGKSYAIATRRNGTQDYTWPHEQLGSNYRMTEMQAAIGRCLLPTIEADVANRNRNARVLDQCLAECGALRVVIPPPNVRDSYYKYYCFLVKPALRRGWNRKRILAAINAEGIPCFSGSCSEIYLERVFERSGNARRLDNARELGETSLMFQVHPTLRTGDMEDTGRAVRKVMAAAMR